MCLSHLKKDLQELVDPKRAKHSQRFFKTGPGEYGEGDKFLGLTMPKIRQVCKKYKDLSLNEISQLLKSPYHDIRMAGVIILTNQAKKAKGNKPQKIFEFYLNNVDGINNWDLVDLSSCYVVGKYLLKNPSQRKTLYQLAKSKNLWERRIAVISTLYFIRYDEFKDALKLATVLVNDKHDLMHKAVGWVLREVGKKDQALEEKFLKQHYQTMPRTMLRYAIEKFSPQKRKFYLNK